MRTHQRPAHDRCGISPGFYGHLKHARPKPEVRSRVPFQGNPEVPTEADNSQIEAASVPAGFCRGLGHVQASSRKLRHLTGLTSLNVLPRVHHWPRTLPKCCVSNARPRRRLP
jgi:hypothetical protein